MKVIIIVTAFSVIDEQLVVCLVDKNGKYFLPQETLVQQESLDFAAQRIFQKSTKISLKNSYIEQLYTFDGVVVSYLALISFHRLKSTQKALWVPYTKVKQLSKKEKEIVQYAKKRLTWKLEYTNVAYSLLSSEFTLSELQKVYEIILGKKLDKRNFRKKILSLKLLSDTNKKRKDVGHRPAKLYRFTKHKPVIVEVL